MSGSLPFRQKHFADGRLADPVEESVNQWTVHPMTWSFVALTKHVCQMSVGQMPVGQMSVRHMSVGQMSVGQMSVGQMSVGQMSVSNVVK